MRHPARHPSHCCLLIAESALFAMPRGSNQRVESLHLGSADERNGGRFSSRRWRRSAHKALQQSTVLAISVTVMTFVLLKFTNLSGIVKSFVFFFSMLLLIFTAISRFTDLTPSAFEVLLYFLYQLGITIGILFGSIRKIKPKKMDLK